MPPPPPPPRPPGFLSKVFDVFARHQVSVDVVATSEVSVSLTLDPKRIWSDGEADEEVDRLVYDLGQIANTKVTKESAIVSLICNVQRTSEILQRVRRRCLFCAGRAGWRRARGGGFVPAPLRPAPPTNALTPAPLLPPRPSPSSWPRASA